MPTAVRKQREAEKGGFNQQCAQLTPAQMDVMRALFGENDDLRFEQAASFLRMGNGLIEIGNNGEIWLSKSIGRGGNLSRENDAIDSAKDLKRKFSGIWGKRGYAKKIAYETGLSVETIRRYCKKVP